MRPIKVVVAEDYPLFKNLLKEFLGADPDIQVVGEASTGLEALARAREARPDVMLVDISLPGMGGLDVARLLRQSTPETKVIILLDDPDESNQEYRRAAEESGASASLAKLSAPFQLVPLVKTLFSTSGEVLIQAGPTKHEAKEMKEVKYRVVPGDEEWFRKNVSCQYRCPALTNVPTYAALISQGRFAEAYEVNRQANVFPSILGRICTRVCQSVCRRALVDAPVSICYLKRSAADHRAVGARAPVRSPATPTHRVAVIGAGPAGLTVAKDLAEMGYGATIFEALPVVGGMLRVGIPAYRLPRHLIDEAAEELRDMGVDIRLNSPVGVEVKLDDLMREYDTVVISAGAHKPEKLGIPGEDLDGVYHGVTFMRKVNLDEEVRLGQGVAVIGLGHTAIDCARSSVRLGAGEVHVVYRRTLEEAAATEEEIEEALEEGVQFHYLASPVRVMSQDGHRASGLECLRNRLGEPDASGRRRPIPIPGSEFVLPVETVIPAVSQAPDISFLPEEVGLELSKWDRLVVDPHTFMTSRQGIFAVGDFITGPRDVIHVIADGHRVAASVDTYLRGPKAVEPKLRLEVLSPYLRWNEYLQIGRFPMPTLPPKERGSLEAEVELGYSTETAQLEAIRCLQCQVNVMVDPQLCILCGGCVDVCPYRALEMVPLNRLEIAGSPPPPWEKGAALVLKEDLCVRCGLCENRCPTKAISMVRFQWEEDHRYLLSRKAPLEATLTQ